MKIRFQNIIYLVLVVQLLIIDCNYSSDKISASHIKVDTSVNALKEPTFTKKIDTTPIKLKKQIIGTWIDLGKEELTVDISKQTFYYREHNERYKYKFDKDTVRIFYREGIISGKPYFINDTLLILASNGWSYKYIKLKE